MFTPMDSSATWPTASCVSATATLTKGPQPLIPGEIYKINIDLWATSNLFRKGHQIRLEISSSNFPRYDRNLNTGEDLLTGKRMVEVNQAVYHDRDHLPAVMLPVLPR